mgnify:CR=1 FL=1
MDPQGIRARAERLDALAELQDAHDAFKALQELIDVAMTPTLTIDRRNFSALLQVLNSQLSNAVDHTRSTAI